MFPSPALSPASAIDTPPRPAQIPVLGVPLALTDYDSTLDWIDAAVAARHRTYLCVAATHTVMAAREDAALREAVLGADFTVPDGQPLIWALNLLGHPLRSRVYGPDLMWKACERAARTGTRFYLHGGRHNQGAMALLIHNLRTAHPGLRIVGGQTQPFGELSAAEEDALAANINRARPDVVWVGLGVPRQELWMQRVRERLGARAGRR